MRVRVSEERGEKRKKCSGRALMRSTRAGRFVTPPLRQAGVLRKMSAEPAMVVRGRKDGEGQRKGRKRTGQVPPGSRGPEITSRILCESPPVTSGVVRGAGDRGGGEDVLNEENEREERRDRQTALGLFGE